MQGRDGLLALHEGGVAMIKTLVFIIAVVAMGFILFDHRDWHG